MATTITSDNGRGSEDRPAALEAALQTDGPGRLTDSATPQYTAKGLAVEAWDQLRLAGPVCLGMLSNRFCATVSTVLVGHQGPAELAAVGLAVSLANVSGYSLLVGVASTLQTTAGQAFGACNLAEVSLSLQRCGLLCSFMLCAIAALWLNAAWLLRLCGQEHEVAVKAAAYLRLLLPGVACYMVTQCLQNWLVAQRVTSPTGTGGILLAIIYLPLCWFIVDPLGFGFTGAAVATSFANFFLMSWIIFRTRRTLRSGLVGSWQGLSWRAFERWGPFIRLALPNFLMISEWWASEITVLLAGTLPQAKPSLAALALMNTTDSICFMPPLALGIAANTRVSNELGAGRPDKARHASCASCFLGLACGAMCSLTVLVGRGGWARLFSTDAGVLDHAIPVLSVSALYVIADGLAACIGGSLKGCGRHAQLAPVVLVAYYFAGLPLSCFLAWPAHLGVLGLAWGSTVGTFVHCLTYSAMLATTSWPLMAQRARERVQAKPLLHSEEAATEGTGS